MKRPPPRGSLAFLRLEITSDAARHGRGWWKHRGFWTTLGYRVRRARKRARAPLGLALLPFDFLAMIARYLASDAELPPSVAIGPSFHLPHPQGVILAADSVIGPGVSIFQQVTLGSWEGGHPRIRSHACVFSGARVIGGVTVGRRAFVGANAVVVRDIPPWHSAVGVPASNRPRGDARDLPAQPC